MVLMALPSPSTALFAPVGGLVEPGVKALGFVLGDWVAGLLEVVGGPVWICIKGSVIGLWLVFPLLRCSLVSAQSFHFPVCTGGCLVGPSVRDVGFVLRDWVFWPLGDSWIWDFGEAFAMVAGGGVVLGRDRFSPSPFCCWHSPFGVHFFSASFGIVSSVLRIFFLNLLGRSWSLRSRWTLMMFLAGCLVDCLNGLDRPLCCLLGIVSVFWPWVATQGQFTGRVPKGL